MVVSHRLTLAADEVFDCSAESDGSCFGGHRKGADAVVVLQGKKLGKKKLLPLEPGKAYLTANTAVLSANPSCCS